jgi:hypothetical protein
MIFMSMDFLHVCLGTWNYYIQASKKYKKWSFKTGDLLKEVQFIWDFQWLDKKKMTF